MSRAGAAYKHGRLFSEGWEENRGSVRGGSSRHMARAAQGASPAFFKMIRTGGCASKSQLTAQFNYLFSKSVDVHDSQGLFDGKKRLSPEQVDTAANRWADEWRGRLNAARTSHMVMSFPKGAKPKHVSLIAGEICREKLGGRFDYMVAVHTDSPNKNPHAHIIVNRRGESGDYFTLRRGTEYSYETFKEAMVEHAARYGIQLEATTRLQRGLVNYPPTDGEWLKAKEHAIKTGTAFEAPAGTPRVGAALARATEEIRDWSLRYRELASFASQQNLQDLATAFEKASSVLAEGGAIISKGEPYMSVEDDFDKAADALRQAVDHAEARIAEAAPNQRPAMERQLADALSSVEHMQPLGARSRDLREVASEEGIYSSQNLSEVNTRFAIEGRQPLADALDGTGIDPVEVEARMRVSAASAALETRWVQQDIHTVAELRGFDLKNEKELASAIEVVDAAYDKVAASYGVDDAIDQRAASVRSTSLDVSQSGHDTISQIERIRAAEAAERAPTASIGSQDGNRPAYDELRAFAHPVGPEDEKKLREAIERTLTREELAALKDGDVSALRGVGDREDQLSMARDYLRASGESEASHAIERVTEELAVERAQAREARGHEGPGHG
ncbi:relaxase/mobilization nuclease domain-containing protein [Paracoccus sp. SM22M-07]|uniref:relaxase/mobilization nuclease domain-containing protein n=1 Tax=Paracoccus sp. SM22M-07 TaxID=1520813 RepID=UPI000931D4D7|nr:relaxase/mobilization nuclease domain-containing protein [Paracoccus sp. SM22M-07]